MMPVAWILALFCLLKVVDCAPPQTMMAFTRHAKRHEGCTSLRDKAFSSVMKDTVNEKEAFFRSLNDYDRLNEATPERTNLLNRLIDNKMTCDVRTALDAKDTAVPLTIENPGRWESMSSVAPGTWKVIYAPHMTTMAKILGGGEFQVQYIMHEDGSMESHARLDFPWLIGLRSLFLSVSGECSPYCEGWRCYFFFWCLRLLRFVMLSYRNLWLGQ